MKTEETFVADLEVLSDTYSASLSQDLYKSFISDRDARALFTNLPQIQLLASTFVSHLKECIPSYIMTCEVASVASSSSPGIPLLDDIESNIGEIVLEYIPNMELAYQVYCAQSKFQMSTFYRINTQGSPMIDKWLLDCRNKSKDRTQAWTLDALLIKPVQRLLKYPLLLASMVEVTPKDHPDYELLNLSLAKMQEVANGINGLEPENVYVQSPTSMDGAPLVPPESPTESQLLDYNTSMSRLKDDIQCDEELEVLIVQFDRKERHVKNLVKSLRVHVHQIQKHFNANSSFAHAWSSWGALEDEDTDNKMDHASRLRVYERFAMFSTAFTTSSQAQVSTNNMHKRVEDEVISLLHDMWLCYYNVSNSLALRVRCHLAYQKYVNWKAANATKEQPPLDAFVLSSADMFFKIHTSLKAELPELFGMTEKVIDACLAKFLTIQRDWFRVAVDSTSNVFGLTLADIRFNKENEDPVVIAFNKYKLSRERQDIETELVICQPQAHSRDDRASVGSFELNRRITPSNCSSASSFSSIASPVNQQSGASVDGRSYAKTAIARSKSPLQELALTPPTPESDHQVSSFSAKSPLIQFEHKGSGLSPHNAHMLRPATASPHSSGLESFDQNNVLVQTISDSHGLQIVSPAASDGPGRSHRRRLSSRTFTPWSRKNSAQD